MSISRRQLVRAVPAAAAALTLPRLAGAHARVERTVPPDGMNLRESPTAIELHFTHPVVVTFLEMRDMYGHPHPLDFAWGASVRHLVAEPVSYLPNGGYTVHWRGLAADGHAVNGMFEFTIG